MSFSCVPISYVLAAETQAITVETVTVSDTDKTATVAIDLSGNPGITSMRLHVSYDTNAMTLVEVKDGGILGTANHPNKLSIYPYILSWANDTVSSDITANGTIATLKFEFKDRIEPGEYEVLVSYNNDNDDILNFDLDTVEFRTNPGKIIVEFVPVNVTGISLNKKSISLAKNEIETLIATISPDNATDKTVVWESDNEAVATVNDNGEVTAISEGNATITAKTAGGKFSDSCAVTVYCPHSNKMEFAETESTCEFQGNNLYYVCDDCGKVFKADGETQTTVENETLPFADHTYVYVSEDPATHFAPGMKSHYACEVCMKTFNLNKNEITDLSFLKIPVIPHSYGNWKSDDTNHWHECGCGNIIDKANHSLVWVTDKEATENAAGIQHEECTICGILRNENTEIPMLSHTHIMTAISAKKATCTAEGNIAYWHCEKCDKYYLDSGGNTEITLADTVIEKIAHNYIEKPDVKYLKSAATCTAKATYYKSCSVCGEQSAETFEHGESNPNNHIGDTYIKNQKEATCYEEGYTGDTYCADCDAKLSSGTVIEKNAHNPASVWSTDENYHWKDCQTIGCGNIVDKASHTGGEATCTKKAICEVCGIQYGEVNADNHKNTEIRNAKAATCTENGYTGDTYCTDCGTKLSDGEVVKSGHILEKINAKEATHYADGNIEYFECSICGKLFKDADAKTEITVKETVIAKGEHSYADGYKTDSESHWKECACGNIIEKSVHGFSDWSIVKEATDYENGSKKRICAVCGYTDTEIIPATGTITEPDKPTHPTEPTTSSGNETETTKPAKVNTSEKSPNTGDDSNYILWIALLLISASSVVITVTTARKKRVR